MERDFTAYNEYIKKLKFDLKSFSSTPKELWNETAIKNVNGVAADELRRLVNIKTRREQGAFFTDSLLVQKVLNFLKPSFNENSFIYDPACGAGNLLIGVWNYVKELNIDLKWENHLLGTDIKKEFVEASKLRLITNCLLNHPHLSSSEYESEIRKIYSINKANGLFKNEFYERATHIIVNPPFNQLVHDEELTWAAGKVSYAALFIDKIIQHSNPGVSITAILPDVLRSGSRYEKWRNMVENKCKIEKEILLGQFDKHADVDVYALQLTKRKKVNLEKKEKSAKVDIAKPVKTLKELFDICVGPVVDNRDPHEGKSLGYIVSRGLENWNEQKEYKQKRNHLGKSFKSPFIVIKRTSRMTDLNRAKAAIINIPSLVYVDNHLIVLQPKSGKLKDCLEALKILKDNRTNDWLNDKIRCRHITNKIVSELPLWT